VKNEKDSAELAVLLAASGYLPPVAPRRCAQLELAMRLLQRQFGSPTAQPPGVTFATETF